MLLLPLPWVWKVIFGWGRTAFLYHLLLYGEVKIECVSIWPVILSQGEKLIEGKDLKTVIGFLCYVQGLKHEVSNMNILDSPTVPMATKATQVATYNFTSFFSSLESIAKSRRASMTSLQESSRTGLIKKKTANFNILLHAMTCYSLLRRKFMAIVIYSRAVNDIGYDQFW